MLVTFAVIGNRQRLLPVTNIVVPGHWYRQIGNGLLFNASYDLVPADW
jgi:type 1 glutamine amidotransferase